MNDLAQRLLELEDILEDIRNLHNTYRPWDEKEIDAEVARNLSTLTKT